MNKQKLIAIVASDENDGIGIHGELPWRLPADLKNFKSITMGHPLIMGRKTFDSLGKPLTGRTNIVISSNICSIQGVKVCATPSAALQEAANSLGGDKAFLIGGGEIYRALWSQVDQVFLTRVETIVNADTFFPGVNLDNWRREECVAYKEDSRHLFSYRFEKWTRI